MLHRMSLIDLRMPLWAAGLLGVCAVAGCPRHTESPRPDASVYGDVDAATPAASDPTRTSRQAVSNTLLRNATCQDIKPFYWEIGDNSAAAVSGSVGVGYKADTMMEIASASKWLYAAYRAQQSHGQLDPAEIPFLNFTSGYASMNSACLGRSIHACNEFSMNTAPGTTDHPGADDVAVGRFDYNSGHLEAHAERFGGLASASAETLGGLIGASLGSDIQLSYANPVLAGGVRTSSNVYTKFLRKLLRGELELSSLLGSHAVCTLSADYAALLQQSCDAVGSPWWPAGSGKLSDTTDTSSVQNVHYSLGHWVEEDGAFSSPGLFGFYPWIDGDKHWYGVIARRQIFKVFDEAHPDTSAYAKSVRCGQALRAAWLDGTEH